MASTPQQSLPDDFATGMACAICGAPSLRVAHLKSFPDYVACGSCKASFVAEADGDRVLYGNIPESFPLASAAALRKWVTLAEVESVAVAERPAPPPPPRPASVAVPSEPAVDREASLRAATSAAVPIPTQPEIERPPIRSVRLEPEDEFEPEEEQAFEADAEVEEPASAGSEAPLGRLSRLMAGSREPEPITDWAPSLIPDRTPVEIPAAAPAALVPVVPAAVARPVAPEPPKPAAPAKPAVPARPVTPPATDPPPGQRYRVVVHGDPVTFPMQGCAHCMRSPAPNRLAIVGSSPQGQGVGQRKTSRFSVPLCRSCYRRATARTVEEKNARLNAHLISALVALGLLVAALAVGLIDSSRDMGVAAVFMLILLVVGYAAPAALLLGRSGRYPPTDDARYVRTTLLIPDASQGLENAFEWRNQRYAEEFYQANHQRALAGVVAIKDRSPNV
jgi:hypothetical protein